MSDSIEVFCGIDGRESRDQSENLRPAVAQERAQRAKLLPQSGIIGMAVQAEPIRSGVYFLIRRGEIVYVGKSVYVMARICAHRTGPKEFDAWAWLPCALADLAAMERAYINAFMPEYNTDSATMALRGGWPDPHKNTKSGAAGGITSGISQEARDAWFAELAEIAADPETVTEDMVNDEKMRRLRAIKAGQTRV